MQIVFIFMVIALWISVWGFSDLLTENFTRQELFIYYGTLMSAVGVFIFIFPHYLDRI